MNIYTDGSGSPKGSYGWYVKETGITHYQKCSGITNNQAEYRAIISALEYVTSLDAADDIVIHSDSMNTVKQLNHEYAINNEQLRVLARQAWVLMAKLGSRLVISWVPRRENPAGRMLGS